VEGVFWGVALVLLCSAGAGQGAGGTSGALLGGVELILGGHRRRLPGKEGHPGVRAAASAGPGSIG